MQNPTLNIGARIRQRRHCLGWSLDAAAASTGVSKAMLGQIERGESSPTVGTLWKIATGMEMSFSMLLGNTVPEAGERLYCADPANSVYDEDGMEAHTLIPFSPSMGFELMVVSLAPGSTHRSSPHAAGVVEHVIPVSASIEICLSDRWTDVTVGQALRFPADQPHAYRNSSSRPASFQNLIRYA